VGLPLLRLLLGLHGHCAEGRFRLLLPLPLLLLMRWLLLMLVLL
jgi:hypothetical protein